MPLRRKLAWIAVLYFAEGLPFGVVNDVLPVYFKVHGVSLAEIGLMALLNLPWTFKFLWSPLVDRYGERRIWIAACLVALGVFTAITPGFDPGAPSLLLWMVLLGMTIASATQDIAIDAYTIGLVERGEEGDANGVRVTAARIALIASGGGLVVFASWFGWQTPFLIAAAAYGVLAVIVIGAPRVVVPLAERRRWFAPMRHWLARPGSLAVLGVALSYKLGDAAMGRMVKPFWIDRGLSVAEIGVVSSSIGMLATIAGALLGGRLTSRWGILRALFVLGLAQALSNLGYATVALLDPPPPSASIASLADLISTAREPVRVMMYSASLVESFTSGLGTAAFLAFLMHVCDKQHAAVQYAVLSALFAFSRDTAGAASGWGATALGYGPYFVLTVFLAFPALGLLPFVRGWIHDRAMSNEC
jgi:PAT family beta-lactamase induction signal transducer AmpG